MEKWILEEIKELQVLLDKAIEKKDLSEKMRRIGMIEAYKAIYVKLTLDNNSKLENPKEIIYGK